MEDEADVVRMCNALLEFAMKTKDEKTKSKADVLRVVTRTPLYIVLCEQFLGRKLDGLERNGGTGDDALKARVRNADCVLKAMAEKLFKIDLCHLSGERVVAGVWEDNKNVIELLFFLCEKKRQEKTTAGHSRASGADKGATESTSSTAVASRPKMKPAVVHARSWRPSSAGRSSPSFASYIDARDRVAAAAATAKAEKDIEAQSEEKDQKVQAVQCTAAKTAMTMNNTFQNGSSSRYIRLSPFKRRGSRTTKKKKTRNSSAAGSFLLLSGDQASPRANEVAKVVVVPSATATKRPEDMHVDLADDPAAPGATAALNSSIVSNSYVNANDESILSLFSFIENNLNSNNIGGLNNESTFIDPSMMLDAHANGGLSNLAQSTVVAKIMHLIKLSQEQRGHENTAGRFTPHGVPLRYERELGRLSTSSALRKRMWIKDRVTDGRVASIRGRRVRAVAARNAHHSNKVEDIMRKRFIDEVDARKRANEVRHQSEELVRSRRNIMDALDIEKQERLSQSRSAAAKSTSMAVRSVKDELKKVEDQDTAHSKMFSSLQVSADKKKRERKAEEKMRAEEMRTRIAETKTKLLLQREKYKEQIEADGEAARFIQQYRAFAQKSQIANALQTLLDGTAAAVQTATT